MSHGPLAGIVWWGERSRVVRERWWRFLSEARESKSNRGGFIFSQGEWGHSPGGRVDDDAVAAIFFG